MDGTIGEIRHFAATFAPRNWAFCNGQIIAIQANTALFAILGTTYGGNGTSNFRLPDLGGRIVIGTGTGPGTSNYTLGENGGINNVTLLTSNLPLHTHGSTASIAIPAIGDGGNANTPDGNILASVANMYNSTSPGEDDLKPASLTVTLTPTGLGQPLSIMQPTIGINYIICMYGSFPARN
ncbi:MULTISPECIES: tail fiber protein [Flavobacterium]|uniref:Tail fiber protein n=1 Tax=Flavobacterium endoglycinae TaxID=2816357 RepID=A0ABX7QE16_9FLAO|nr:MULTISPECIES: tail fiber protein [Flavobacterium]QSW88748.1 tail fiber protein [Flavobacterium endoglycinae]